MTPIVRSLAFTICISSTATVALAETYVGGSAGWSFDQRITSVKGDENTNYPDPPDPAGGFPLLPGSRISDLNLEDSIDLGLRAGFFFERNPSFGFEGSFNYGQPSFRRQLVTLTHPDFTQITPNGADHVTEDQLRALAGKFVFALNAVYRYQGFKDFTPYIAGGPALFVFHVHGTGFSGIVPEFDIPGVPAPPLNETTAEIGFDVKAGVEYNLGNNWGLGAEYRYEWSEIGLDSFRSLSNATGHFHASSVDLTITRHF